MAFSQILTVCYAIFYIFHLTENTRGINLDQIPLFKKWPTTWDITVVSPSPIEQIKTDFEGEKVPTKGTFLVRAIAKQKLC